MDPSRPTPSSLLARAHRKLAYLQDRRFLKENRVLKDAHRGASCFIIGNGPSIKSQDLTPLSNAWTFAANSFFRHEQYDRIHPKFYVIMDSEHFKGHAGSKEFFTELEKKLHADTIVFLPLKAKEFIEKNDYLSRNVKHYIYVRGQFKDNGTSNISIDRTIPSTMGVGLMCMIIAEYMGFGEIYLLGFDHNWLANAVTRPIERFYTDHYFKDDTDDTYELRIWCQYVLFRGYRILRRMMKAQVFNLTPGSFLDVFPTKIYEQVLESKRIR